MKRAGGNRRFSKLQSEKDNQHGTRDHHFSMHRMQEPELFGHQEQEDHHGAAGNEEILPVLPEAPAAQGNQVELKRIGA
jgi:hypothetical protein